MRKHTPFFLLIIVTLFLSCGGDDKPSPVKLAIPADFAGMCHSGYSSNLEREYGMLNEMGVVWLHRDFSWSSIQPAENTWNWTTFDDFVARGKTEGKKIMGMLLYDVDWVHVKYNHPATDDVTRIWADELPHFVEYAKATVKRYNGKNGHPKVDAWLIWNEPDLVNPARFWTGTKEEFFALTKETAEAIRELDAQEGTKTTLVGGVFSIKILNDVDWITGLFNSGAMEKVDLISVHPYSIAAESSASVFKKFKEKVTPYGFADKIWVNEMGYPTYSDPGPIPAGRQGTDQYEGDMPDVVTKTFVLLAAAGAKNLTWYHMFDGASRNNANSENWFGLVWQKSADEWIKKGGYYGYVLCANNIPGTTYKEKSFFSGKVSDSVQSHYFEGSGGKRTLVVWNSSPIKNAEVKLSFKGSGHKLWDPASGGSVGIDKKSTHTLYPANTGQKTLLFITWQE